MSDPKAHVAVFVDFDSLARQASTAGEAFDAGEVATAILRYAGGVGRTTVARGYADWSRRGDDVKAVQAARLVPVLCPTGPAAEDRAPFRLAVDALAALYAGGEPDAFVLATADGRLLPLVHALRADGADVLLVMPASATADDLRAEADVTATLADVLGGAVGPASEPRTATEEEEAPVAAPVAPPAPPRFERVPARGGYDDAPRGSFDAPARGGDAPARGGDAPARGWDGPRRDPAAPPPRRSFDAPRRDYDAPPVRRGFESPPRRAFDAPARGGPERGPRGYDPESLDTNYDWSGFVRLIDELEHRLPFVGVRYLVNKVLGPRNCGIDDPRRKRDLINRAVEEGLVSMFEVGNLEGRGDPVTACRLDRTSPAVVAVLGGATATPNVAEARDEFAPVDEDTEAVEPDGEDPRGED